MCVRIGYPSRRHRAGQPTGPWSCHHPSGFPGSARGFHDPQGSGIVIGYRSQYPSTHPSIHSFGPPPPPPPPQPTPIAPTHPPPIRHPSHLSHLSYLPAAASASWGGTRPPLQSPPSALPLPSTLLHPKGDTRHLCCSKAPSSTASHPAQSGRQPIRATAAATL